MEDEEKTSGIECDLSEVEKTLEEIAEKEAEAEDTVENEKRHYQQSETFYSRGPRGQ